MISHILRIYHSIKKYILKDTRYFLLYSIRYFQANYKHDVQFYKEQDVPDILAKGKSLIRLGDGEIGLLHYLPRHYQVYSDSIRNDFLDIIKKYNDSSPYIIMIPYFVNYSNADLKKIRSDYLQCWLPLKISFEQIFNKKATYLDQHLFYRDERFKNLVFPYIQHKHIIVVTEEKNKKRINDSELSKSLYAFVNSPSTNAYEARDKIRDEITSIITTSPYKKEDFVILMIAGLAKTIIAELSSQGYQLIDWGLGNETIGKNISIEYLI